MTARSSTSHAVTAKPSPLVLEEFLPYRLAVAAGAVSRGLSAIYADTFDLDIAEWRIIANLGRFGALTAGAVAEQSTLDKPKVTRALQRLTNRRLVSRKTDRQDRRALTLTLTAEGARVFKDIAALALVWERELLQELSAAERTVLLGALEKLEARATALGSRPR